MPDLPLSTARLQLRDFVPQDVAAYAALRCGQYFGRHYAPSELTAEFSASLLARFISWQAEQPRRHWQLAITLNDGTLIGSLGVRLAERHGEASFGIELGEAWWGQGYAIEAAGCLLSVAFNQLGVHRIEADTAAANVAAQQLATRLGFVHSRQVGERVQLALAVALPGIETEWRLQSPHSRMQRLEGCWQLASPHRPDFYYGNLLLPDSPPQDRAEWEARFDRAFASDSRVRHRTFCWQRGDDERREHYADWLAAGYHYDESAVLMATRDCLQSQPLPAGLQLRALQDEADWLQWQQLAMQTRDSAHDAAGYQRFLLGAQTQYRQLQARGQGAIHGVFAAGELLASAGLFVWQAMARYQLVMTAPAARRQGLASALVSQLGVQALQQVPRVIIVADEHYHALDLYRKLGFMLASREVSLCRWPQ